MALSVRAGSTYEVTSSYNVPLRISASAQIGDTAYVVVGWYHGYGWDISNIPAGWTKEAEFYFASHGNLLVLKRTVQSGDPGSMTNGGFNGYNTQLYVAAFVVGGATHTQTVIAGTSAQSASVDFPAVSVPAGADALVIAVARWSNGWDNNFPFTPSGYSAITPVVGSNGFSSRAFYRDLGSGASVRNEDPPGYGTPGNQNIPWSTLSFAVVQPNTAPGSPGLFTSPTAGGTVDTVNTVAWGAATDADGDSVTYDVDLSTNNGAGWTPVRVKQAGTSFTYDYTYVATTTTAKWRVRAWDGLAYGAYTYSPNFEVLHTLYVPAVML